MLAAGLVCTLGLATLAARRAREQARREFDDRSRLVAAHVEQSFNAPLEALYGIHALGCALPDVDQARFEQFASRLIERYPSLAALELFDVVRGDERDDFERRLSARLGYAFSFQEPASAPPFGMVVSPRRERHVVLTRLLPFHKELHGLDITFDPLRREQIAAATRAGTATVTEKFRLVEDPEGVFSVAVYDPLYADGQVPATEAERESELRGFAIALYRLAPLMHAALSGTELGKSSIALVDRDPRLSQGDALLFGSREALQARDFEFHYDLHFAGRAWTFVSSRSAPPQLATAAPTLVVGSFGSVLLAALVALVVSLRASRRRFHALEALGPYTLLREIGGGGMGRVYEAQHSLLRRPAAIKVIAQEQASAEQLRRFDLEAKMTSRLCHPNTVVVFDYGRTRRGDFYYAMEYVDGITWETLVRRYGSQPAARARHLLVQACGALSEAHGLGLVHRDIKPSNLMLRQGGGIFDFVKVLDFGLVRVTRGIEAGMSGPGTLLGTPRYMAPEAFASSQSGPRADLYSLGCVAYFLLSGHEPFTAKTDAGVATLHLTRMPPTLQGRCQPDFTPAFERVVMRCLAKNPDERYSSAAHLLRALAELDLPPWTQAEAAAFWAEHPTPELPQ
ncbi:MAG TPA: CHASE domain-containing protein [Polyangiaceae bacterium]|nr:CHASE domain-containing protein [Polyangiaceae bacterium]